MSYDLSEIFKAIERFTERVIYDTEPSKSDRALPSWRRFNGDDTENSSKAVRLFDIYIGDEIPPMVITGNGKDSYDIQAQIKIEYLNDVSMNAIASSDYIKIKNALCDSDKTELYAVGFEFFFFESEGNIEAADDEEEDYRNLIFPVMCRVEVAH